MPRARIESANPVFERSKRVRALDRAAVRTGKFISRKNILFRAVILYEQRVVPNIFPYLRNTVGNYRYSFGYDWNAKNKFQICLWISVKLS